MRKIIAGISRFFTPRISKILLICMIILLAGMAWYPSSHYAIAFRSNMSCAYLNSAGEPVSRLFSLTPFHSIRNLLPYITPFYFMNYLRIYGLKTLLALPFGLAVPYAFPTKRYIWLLFSLYFVLLELLQPLFLVGTCDIDIILYYLLGYALGILIATLIRRMERNTAVSLPSKQKK